ncbi:MAG: Aconitate hydratase [Hydrogenibacillus schlegelii]|uniref:Aconitate hydratase n=1 Tax=Hydrogenibacillus schlegelii TaxID=1484 RepID=A0A2T5G9L7_HYDSH|nr:aconitate hydratase AcnA [Hydrogenibacillus schlegelii]PTQ52885.1 MAG: Aconitate hydratase [Hydrogenibacillus schlegelii]
MDVRTLWRELIVDGKAYRYVALPELRHFGYRPERLPFSIRVLLEAAIRQLDGRAITEEHVRLIAGWETADKTKEIPFLPARIVLQDFTGVPAVVDLAAMREAVAKRGGDPRRINPLVPVDLVIDHSVMVDVYGSKEALEANMEYEFRRNMERYRFLRWAQKAFDDFRVVPPATGIVHQVNLEYLATLVREKETPDGTVLFPDSLVGTDSHTTMINGLGVVGWGVGGIEAEAGMLGQPLYFLLPEVVGFRLTGKLPEGATATDLVLTVTHILRKKGVVGKFVEFFGPGVKTLSLADRATVANMAPEYGATMGYFPVDEESIRYLALTGRDEALVRRVEAYYKAQEMFYGDGTPDPVYSDVVELDLATVVPTIAGPRRPQDRIDLDKARATIETLFEKPVAEGGYGLAGEARERAVLVRHPSGETSTLRHGSIVIAAITSCTNTSNPSVMIGAGLVAKKAVERGLKVPPYVKTSLAPGSRVVTRYLEDAGLLEALEKLGFAVVGYGCTTCIGNSGPLPDEVSAAIRDGDLTVAAVLSGNRNFEGRIHAQVKANFLASPPLVVAYAIAGRVDIDLMTEPLGTDREGRPVYLKDLWPTSQEIQDAILKTVTPEKFRETYRDVFTGNSRWNAIDVPEGTLYAWDPNSTYIQHPPFFEGLEAERGIRDIRGARALLLLGDSVTTDHISPAGAIAPDSPAGRYLLERGVAQRDFNSYGSRRGNHEVMMRGTFANIRLRNLMLPGTEGGVTKHFPSGEIMSVYEAAMRYRAAGTPLVVLAGKEYGTGSSRDWAAKGTALLGIRAVIAESFERIHRSNLVGMGVLPLEFMPGESWRSLGLTGEEIFDIEGLHDDLRPGAVLTVRATRPDGRVTTFNVKSRLDSVVEIDYYKNGGILQTVLKQLMA